MQIKMSPLPLEMIIFASVISVSGKESKQLICKINQVSFVSTYGCQIQMFKLLIQKNSKQIKKNTF